MSLPRGPHAVGTVASALQDDSRPAHIGSMRAGRSLRLKLWYPAEPSPALAPELLWESLRQVAGLPLPLRLLLWRMKSRSASLPGATRARGRGIPAATVLYNHGFVSFAAENTGLMEELASHGHLVVAIEHMEQLPELRTLQRAQPVAERRRARELERVMRDRARRAAVLREYTEASTNTNRIVRERARDTSFVLDRLPEVLAAIPAVDAPAPAGPVILAGFSAGGAVSLTAASDDARVAAVINLDGGTHGVIDATDVRPPCLMLYSHANDGINDALLPPHAVRERAPQGSRHLNLHDAAALWPRSLRLLGATGPCDPREVLRWRDRCVAEFCGSIART